MMNLFDSADSGRPAAYDAGSGPISTAHIRTFPAPPEDMPPEYLEAVASFQAGLPEASALRVEFTVDLFPGESFEAAFPIEGLGPMTAELARYCPLP